jgi:DNA repair protein RecN (Recombination protein N)
MLVELMVENYAVIERLRIRFHAGFNVLSGETGSGKSIVVGALSLLFGGRASADLVRTGFDRARISGIFEVRESSALRALLEPAGITLEEGELLVEREVLSNGKTRSFAGSRPVTVSLLKALASHLGDIHGQHDQQRLFDEDEQLRMLDEFARPGELAAETARWYEQWTEARAGLEQLDRTEQERLRLADLWAYQVKEIEAVAPQAGEDARLDQERRLLQNLTRIQENASLAYENLYDSPHSAVSQLRVARKKIEELCRIDPSLEPLSESLAAAEAQANDASHILRDYTGRLEGDPARLDEVESRLAALEKVKRKYGPSLDDVTRFLETTRSQLESAENTEARREALRTRLAQAASGYTEAAQRLTLLRQQAARKLEKRVEGELGSLAMERACFRVAISSGQWTASGCDAVRFLLSANPGEEPKLLDRIASGGELSRVALALRTCLLAPGASRKAAQRTLVFDEVDAGIGGRAAETVGRRLKQLAVASQVLCVTHLAQIAGFADHHYSVEKKESKGRTIAAVEELDGEARTREIGRMLSGQLTPEALKHAEQLIRLASAG